MKLFHVSDQAGITRFVPRPAALNPDIGPFIWAVAEPHLPNYLLPRLPQSDVRRIGFTTSADRVRFGLQVQKRIIVLEAAWLKRVANCEVYRYVMPADPFVLHDPSAGYWVASETLIPIGVNVVSDVARAIADLGGELRVVKRLWDLHDAVAASSLEFSMIRMRHAVRD